MTISRSIILRMKYVLDKSYTENKNTLLSSIIFFFSKTVQFVRCRKKWWRQRGHTWQYGAWALHAIYTKYECTHAHPQKYVILIVFPRQQFLYESASMLRYMYTVLCICNNGLDIWMVWRLNMASNHYHTWLYKTPYRKVCSHVCTTPSILNLYSDTFTHILNCNYNNYDKQTNRLVLFYSKRFTVTTL